MSDVDPDADPDPHGHVARMARAGSRNLVAAGVSAASNVLLVLVVTNAFDREVSGTLFASTSLFLLLASTCELGTDVGLARWIPRYLVAGRPDAARRALRVATFPVLTASVVVGLALVVLATRIAPLLDDGGREADLVTALRLLGACLPITALYDTVLAATRAHGDIGATIAVERLGRAVAQMLAIVVTWALGGGAVALVAAWTAPYAVGLVVGWGWLARIRHTTAPVGAHGHRDTTDVRASFWRFTTPRAVGQIVQVALQRLDIVLVAGLLGLRAGAVYTAATRFLVFGQVGTLAVQQVLQPQLSELLARHDVRGAGRAFETATAWIMALTWPVYLSFATVAPVALRVFGDGYGSGEATVVILSLTMLLSTAAGPVDSLLLMAGRSAVSLANNVVALTANVVLNLVLIPIHGITGAAIAWSVAIVIRNVLPFVQVYRALGISAVGRATTTVAACTFVPLAVAAVPARLVLASGSDAGALLVVPGLLAAVAALWRTRDDTGVGALLGILGGRRPRGATPA